MKKVSYKVVKLEEPDGDKTHRLEFEAISKGKDCGGYNCGVLFKGTYKECVKKRKEYVNGI